MNPNHAPKRPVVDVRTGWGWPATRIVTVAAPRNARSGFRRPLKALARGDFTRGVEGEMKRLDRTGANAKNSN